MTEGRLLLGTEDGWPLGWQAHGDLHGRLGRIDGPSLADAVHAAGLRGRGGASFPTAVKLRAVAARRRAVVLVNAAEGEPLSAKDRTLCELAPHLVLDGALAAADAVRARQVVIAVRGEAKAAASSLRAAIAERGARSVDVVQVPTAYLAGEESALIRHLGGGPLRPVVTPPRPAQRGLRGRPTLVQNAETLAHVALIARHGPEWFRQVGTAEDPGTALVTVSGAVARPGVAEIAHGETLTAVLDRAGGVTEPPRAVLLGGFHGTWLPADAPGDLRLDARSLGHHGATLAAGVVFVLASPPARWVRSRRSSAGSPSRAPGSAARARTASPPSRPSSSGSPTVAAAATWCCAGPASSPAGAPAGCPTARCASCAARSTRSQSSSPSTSATGRACSATGRARSRRGRPSPGEPRRE